MTLGLRRGNSMGGGCRSAVAMLALLALFGTSFSQAAEPAAKDAGASNDPRPNIVWITCEDISPHVGAYGDTYAYTPNIDKLATVSVRYDNAFAPIGVCAPARSCLITGMYPPTLGSQNMRCNVTLPPHVQCFPYYLRQAGYYCTNNVKTDYNFAAPPGTWDESSRQADWTGRAPGQPFFCVFNFEQSHESKIRLPKAAYDKAMATVPAEAKHDPAKATVPPYHPDVKEVREDWAHYADAISVMDKKVGEVLKRLEKEGLADNTIVWFFSDHGAGMPRSKRWLYDSSLKVPLLIHFPEKFAFDAPGKPGTATDRMVSFVDFGPTVLSLAGVPVASNMEGEAFLGKEAKPPREYIYGFRDRMDERIDMLRGVRDSRYKYIRNFIPYQPYAQKLEYMYLMPTMRAWQKLHDQGKLNEVQDKFFLPKSGEELYDTQTDPDEIHNLADDPKYQKELERLRAETYRWMDSINDLGLLPESEMYLRAAGKPPETLAGNSKLYPKKELLAAVRLPGQGASSLAKMTDALKSKDAAVRFWGLVALASIGEEAAPAKEAVLKATTDPSMTVRVEAARVLFNLGDDSQAMPVVINVLDRGDYWEVLRAALLLDELGDRARPALDSLQQVDVGNNQYIPRVVPQLLTKFGVPVPPDMKPMPKAGAPKKKAQQAKKGDQAKAPN